MPGLFVRHRNESEPHCKKNKTQPLTYVKVDQAYDVTLCTIREPFVHVCVCLYTFMHVCVCVCIDACTFSSM